jgi:GNAT superfamily N-acetyltransferase
MAVLDEYQRIGIGLMLLKKAEYYARENHAFKIWMDTSTRLTDAIEFYKKNNYEIVGMLRKHFWGEDIILLEKIL